MPTAKMFFFFFLVETKAKMKRCVVCKRKMPVPHWLYCDRDECRRGRDRQLYAQKKRLTKHSK